MSWLWSITNATHQVREHGDGLGRSASLVSTLLSGNHNRLSGIFHWSSILQGWSRPQIQHDVAAFATHALTRLRSPVMMARGMRKERTHIAVLLMRDRFISPSPLPSQLKLSHCRSAWIRGISKMHCMQWGWLRPYLRCNSAGSGTDPTDM